MTRHLQTGPRHLFPQANKHASRRQFQGSREVDMLGSAQELGSSQPVGVDWVRLADLALDSPELLKGGGRGV